MKSEAGESLGNSSERHSDLAHSSVSPSSSSAVTARPLPAKRRRNNIGVPSESCLTCRARKVGSTVDLSQATFSQFRSKSFSDNRFAVLIYLRLH